MTIPENMPADGFAIPLRASFTVFKRFPLLGVASNNHGPRLILFHDSVQYRVIITGQHNVQDIEHIDALQTFGTQNIVFCWRRRLCAFSANVGDADVLRSLLRYFTKRQVQLTERAHKIMTSE